jgi:hypothetical protein
MHYYAGRQKGDNRPIGGGSWNVSNIGHELFNFKDYRGTLYGFFQPFSREDVQVTVNLARIDPRAAKRDSIDEVLVVIVATIPGRGQAVIGWYDKATVYREYRSSPHQQGYYFNFRARTDDSCLLPERFRTHSVPTGKNAFGQASVAYPFSSTGSARIGGGKDFSWMDNTLDFVSQYTGPNLLNDPAADVEQEVKDVYERYLSKQSGQGFMLDSRLRRQIEDYAVRRASTFFTSKGFAVENVGSKRSYDLECRRPGVQLRVEVKGTQSDGKCILLTPNEVANARKSRTALFVLHSIRVAKSGQGYKLSGGIEAVRDPWEIRAHGRLKPLSFIYHLGRRHA